MPRHTRIIAAGYPMLAILRGIDRGATGEKGREKVEYRAGIPRP